MKCPECRADMYDYEWQPCSGDPVKFEMMECERCDEQGYKNDYEMMLKRKGLIVTDEEPV